MIEHTIPDLKIERDDQSGCILLEQDSGGNIDRVALHPLHVRFLAEQCGLVDTSDPEALKIVATLKRRFRLLRDRIDHLTDSLAKNKDFDRADINYEVTYAVATADIADEFVAELDETGKPSGLPAGSQSVAQQDGNSRSTPVQQSSPKSGLVPNQDTLRPHPVRTESGQKSEAGK
jgi:hypothetical protein